MLILYLERLQKHVLLNILYKVLDVVNCPFLGIGNEYLYLEYCKILKLDNR